METGETVYQLSAIDNQKFNNYLETADKLVIVRNWVELKILIDLFGFQIEDLQQIKEKFAFLSMFLDFTILEKRSFIPKDDHYDVFRKQYITTYVPELITIVNQMGEIVNKVPKSFEKAEAWFLGSAIHYYLDSSLESVIYFHICTGLDVPKEALIEDFRIRANKKLAEDRLYNKGSKSIIKKASQRKLTIREAFRELEYNGSRPRLLQYYDNEEEFIESTYIRAVDCLGLSELRPYLQDYIDDISNSYQGDLDQIQSLLYFFNICRSDAIIQNGNSVSLEALLRIFASGSVDKFKPWRVNGYPWSRSAKKVRNVDYIRIACIVVFGWVRIEPKNMNNQIFHDSIEFILRTQLPNGSWPLLSHLKTGELLTTAFAIHALGAAKPIGWQEAATKAKSWLISQLNEVGCWTIQGGPTHHINVFCLEAIRIADSKKVSFAINPNRFITEQRRLSVLPNSEKNTIVLCEGNPDGVQNRQFDALCYSRIFASKYPNVIFYSIGSCEDVKIDKIGVYRALSEIFPRFTVFRVVDRDDLNDVEVKELENNNIKVLSLRNIESYLLDDEVLWKICERNSRPDLYPLLQAKKAESLKMSIEAGYQSDDMKKVAGDLYLYLKNELHLNREGNTKHAFMRDYIAPLITSDMAIYKKLEKDLFN